MIGATHTDYQRVFDHLLEGCQILSPDWRYLYINEAAARHGRKPAAELLGRTMTDAYPGIDQTPVFETLARCMATRLPETLTTEFHYDDGTSAWFELKMRPVPEGLFVMSQDVTKEKLADTMINAQLRRLGALRAIDLAILGSTDWRIAIRTVLVEAQAQLGVDRGAILLAARDRHVLALAASAGVPESAARIAVRFGEGVAGRAALERRTVSVTNAAELDASDPLRAMSSGRASATLHATPLLSRAKLLGVLVAEAGPSARGTADWIGFFEALAGQAAMAIESGQAFEELQRSNLDLTLAYEATLEGWSRALEVRDSDTKGHTARVTSATVTLARLAGLGDAEITHIRRGALLHDIGKIGVPDAVLHKAGPLSVDEWALMRQHPTIAHDLLRAIPFLRPALDIPYCHHERWDGTGYPRGLAGDAIPFAARLFAIVDVWDALRSDRPYRTRWDEDRVIAYLRQESGRHFEPAVVDLFMRSGLSKPEADREG